MKQVQDLPFEKPLYFQWMLDQCLNWAAGSIEPVILQQMEDIIRCWNFQNLGDDQMLASAALNLSKNLIANEFYFLVESVVTDLVDSVTDPEFVYPLLERVAISQEKLREWARVNLPMISQAEYMDDFDSNNPLHCIAAMPARFNRLELPQGITFDCYPQVKKILRDAGGKYQSNGFNFKDQDAMEIRDALASGERINDKKKFQFFATPDNLAKQLVDMAEIGPEDRVLEPSAGQGAIADAAGVPWSDR